MTKQPGVPESARPLRPCNDTARIAMALGLKTGSPSDELLLISLEATIHQRALRSQYVPLELLNDPAWEMLLELFHAELRKRRVTASILCKAARVSASTGKRWIDVLICRDLCAPITGADDLDRMFMQLSEQGSAVMRGYFTDLAAI